MLENLESVNLMNHTPWRATVRCFGGLGVIHNLLGHTLDRYKLIEFMNDLGSIQSRGVPRL